MSEFNFSLADSQVSSKTSNYFKPYTINEIDTIKAEYASGTSSNGKDWKALDVTFSGKDGQIRERYFIPETEKDGMTRPTFDTSNGGKTETPSSYEILKQLAIHVLGVYAPAQFEKFKTYCQKVKNMQQYLDGFIKLVNDAPSNTTHIKVVGKNNNGTVYARLPRPCNVEKDKDGSFTNRTYPINFLGDNLKWTNYEAGEMEKLKNAKPTPMNDELNSVDAPADNLSEVDWNSLL